jgi:hypothetical protein
LIRDGFGRQDVRVRTDEAEVPEDGGPSQGDGDSDRRPGVTAVVQLTLAVTAICLIVVTVWSLVTGNAHATGAAVRAQLTPALTTIRSTTAMSRAELADASLILALGLAAVSMIVDRTYLAAVMIPLLWLSRPSVRRLTSEERPMFALGGELSGNLVVGLFAPIALAHLLLGNGFLAASLLAVTVALCWPPGGGRRVSGTWRPVWLA